MRHHRDDDPIIPRDRVAEALEKLKGRTIREGIMVLPAIFKVPNTAGPRDTSGINEFDAMLTRTPQLHDGTARKRMTKSRIALEELMAGGESRQAIYPRIRARFEAEWGRDARIDQVPQVVYQLLNRLKAKGWTVESLWRVVPPGGKTFVPESLDDLDTSFFVDDDPAA